MREKFSSLRTSAASVSFERILASPEFRRKLEFVQQISGELPFKTADNVLANVGQEFECTGISRVSSLIFHPVEYAITYCPLPPVAMNKFLCSG